MNTEVYAIYLTAASGTHPAGYVVNNVLAGSADTITPVPGQSAIPDPDRKYPIGSTYSASAS